ncbi:MAG: hypothetical protein AABW92_00700 [Nanoarchaeota archaeon]
MSEIVNIIAREILDSRGNPTNLLINVDENKLRTTLTMLSSPNKKRGSYA